MKQNKISIIIPVYNVEMYLEKCLESVLNQTYKNLEVILVDDGSTDKSGLICDEYQKNDSRIRVVHQDNQGLAAARNTGLQYVSGEYFSFVDSDDYIDLNTYRKVCTYIEKEKCDICFWGHYRVNKTQSVMYDIPPKKLEYTGKEEILEMFLTNTLSGHPGNGMSFTGLSVCCGIYKTDLVKKKCLRFHSEKEILSEDILFNMEACICADKLSVYPEYLYYYRQRTASLTEKYRKDRFCAAVRLDKAMKQLALEYGVSKWLEKGIDYCFRMNLIVCLKQEIYFKKQNGYQKLMEHICEIGTASRTQEYLKNNMAEGIKRKILFQALKLQKWSLVYCIIHVWTSLEKIMKK